MQPIKGGKKCLKSLTLFGSHQLPQLINSISQASIDQNVCPRFPLFWVSPFLSSLSPSLSLSLSISLHFSLTQNNKSFPEPRNFCDGFRCRKFRRLASQSISNNFILSNDPL
uniref:Uncharacterized protein n=1 Tax=Opuntia streptacantha TaxID=393608 RepID=A0A7C9ECT9_OPUST